MKKVNITVKEVSWHRNGIGGTGFHAVHFVDHDQVGRDNKDAEMLGIVFDKPGHCAVIQINQPGDFTVKFGKNSWRGENYEPSLRDAIKKMESSGSVRVGPFGLPSM